MGAFLDRPKTEKLNEHGEGNGLRYGLCSMQGWRVDMEDAHSAMPELGDRLKNWSFFAIYDGHAGSGVARYCAQHLLHHITGSREFTGLLEGRLDTPAAVETVRRAIRNGFLNIDERMRSDAALAENDMDRSGSTAVALLVSPWHVYLINCGDSRGVLQRGRSEHFCTEDHKPCNPRERERIQRAGGSVMVQRVNGSLAVSRALGDYDYKCVDGKGPTEQLVSPEPEVTVIERSPRDEFAVLACDGIWDVMSNEELCAFVRSRLEITDDLELICNMVADTCLYKGSRDNMSIELVCFENAPRPSEEAKRREAELDAYLEARVKELVTNAGPEGPPGMLDVMHTMLMENISNLPPGGGLTSKRSTIETVYNQLVPEQADQELEDAGGTL